MKRRFYSLALLLISVALPLAACQAPAAKPTKVAPAQVEAIDSSDVKRVVLTEHAAERLGIATTLVTEELAERQREVGGQVVGSPEADAFLVRVSVSRGDLAKIDRKQPAIVLSMDDDGEDSDEEEGVEAEAASDSEEENGATALFYSFPKAQQPNLQLGQPVRLKLTLVSSTDRVKVVPYAAIIYDVNGKTWVYAKDPNTLAYVRVSVTIDYIDDEEAFLSDGPPVGTEVVTVGGSLLYGTETGVSK